MNDQIACENASGSVDNIKDIECNGHALPKEGVLVTSFLEGEDAHEYMKSSPFFRAFPERVFALMITLCIEIPVAVIVVSGSNLCDLVGQDRYALIMAFLPVTSAISGNVGLQCSSLTTRAISHVQVCPRTWWKWLRIELIVAALLGLAVFVVQLCVLTIWTKVSFGTPDMGIAITVAFAQFLTIVVAGATGTFAPMFFKFVLNRDAGKWAGPLETAVQDVVGAFCMTYVATWLMTAFVKLNLSPQFHGTCGDS
mmetsp:Transcript_17414/g.29753  ORF Transcript_17414/g.29753 Transcript_17414/m.29753 type:complete len:254 (+) Transcript_17414:933-1694(+)|eukprot:CAMPEP_0203756960 /NCGR_PEP_ID=MMETSP0098-20131031/10132_1 /ASSEMBLY_ACC=CAM_ASM_000208 /TAXON_ID=96639 /ORGANISM=" , Strain NY0313808BC1" /LENGTH=253 /DNA_ID=CAMNT_0050649025 /DNA_START=886 /DNA_END=1647 /DNA_ORIENTATION=+